jgi:hypothetical protein
MDISIPLSLPDLCVGALVGVFALFTTLVLTVRSPERGLFLAAAATKVLYCFLFCFLGLHVLSVGDVLGYHTNGIALADRIRTDFPRGLTEYLEDSPFFLLTGSNTTRCRSLSGLAHLLTLDSFVGSSLIFAMIALVGQVLIYRAFTSLYPDARVRNWWRAGILFLPSLNFWSSGLLKDPPGLLGLGCAFWGLHSFLSGHRARHFAVLVLGVYTLMLYRAQVVPVLLISATPLLFGTGLSRARTPAWLPRAVRRSVSIAMVLAVCALVVQSERRFVLSESVLNELAKERHNFAGTVAGSTVIDRNDQVVERSGLAVLAFWPEAVLLALYRPFPWEGLSSPAMLVASIENTILLLLTLRLVFLNMSVASLAEAVRSPVMLECLIFVAVFAFAIGFSTPNLGTISRYRIPMVPYFVGVVTIMEALRLRRRDRSQWLSWRSGAGPALVGSGPGA